MDETRRSTDERLTGGYNCPGTLATRICGRRRESGVEEQGLAVVKMTNPMLPLVDPAEYHVSSPVPSLDGGATVYILNLSRYERIR